MDRVILHCLKDMFENAVSAATSFFSWIQKLYESSQPAQVVQLNSKRFTILKLLGEGGFSYVYMVKEVGSYGQPYALKRIRVQLPEQEVRLRNEISFHGAISHPNVIRLLDSCLLQKNGRITEGLLLLPYYKNGTVQDLIDKSIHGIPLTSALRIAMGVMQGLRAFHNNDPPLSFRDLKPANILLDENGKPILMDLGSVAPAQVVIRNRKEALAFQELCSETVTAPFRAPELFDPPSDGCIDESCDIWALGCTVYTMLFKEPPFDGTMTATISGKLYFKGTCPPSVRAFLESLVQVNPHSRPKIDQTMYACEMLLHSLSTTSAVV